MLRKKVTIKLFILACLCCNISFPLPHSKPQLIPAPFAGVEVGGTILKSHKSNQTTLG